jgi:hypothetical protein
MLNKYSKSIGSKGLQIVTAPGGHIPRSAPGQMIQHSHTLFQIQLILRSPTILASVILIILLSVNT